MAFESISVYSTMGLFFGAIPMAFFMLFKKRYALGIISVVICGLLSFLFPNILSISIIAAMVFLIVALIVPKAKSGDTDEEEATEDQDDEEAEDSGEAEEDEKAAEAEKGSKKPEVNAEPNGPDSGAAAESAEQKK